MDIIREIQGTRGNIMQVIDAEFEALIRKLESNSGEMQSGQAEGYETIYPITVNPAVFKGKKPNAVIIRGNQVYVKNWKMVVKEIMKDCTADTERHVALMNLRGRISGRERVLLAKESGQMRSPLKVEENLYIETHYDTETLLRTFLSRILDAVGYDYSNIMVAIRNAS